MIFEEFFNEELEIEGKEEKEVIEKITPNQVYDVITSKKPDWQTIIYDLINSEQLDPWDIDIIVLTNKYFERIFQIEDIDFYISSKVLFAASLLLRIKSEFLLNKYIRSIDEILFGKKPVVKEIERIEIDDSELPFLIPKTPLPRLRKITLNELMEALNKAINTETRRIKKELAIKRAHKLAQVDIPQFKKINIKDRIRELYARILTALKKHENAEKVAYSNIAGKEKEQKIACFLPLLHLSNTKKLWVDQEKHLDEIWIYHYNYFELNKTKFLEDLEQDIEMMKEELASAENLDEKKSSLEIAKQKKEEKNQFKEEIRKELEEEFKEIENVAKDLAE
ncbi:segregation/condensation protein A [Candidatus Pacearchaeota archaeon]|nr:segregation/condensation protein A [Candidatus Pacearchaeota archaeon]